MECVFNLNYSPGEKYVRAGFNVFFKSMDDDTEILIDQTMALLWRGYIYNRETLGFGLDTTNAGIILTLYKTEKDIEKVLRRIEGDFSFILIDYRIFELESCMYVVRDIEGIFPLYYDRSANIISSIRGTILPSKSFSLFTLSTNVSAKWELKEKALYYFFPPMPFFNSLQTETQTEIEENGKKYLALAIQKRVNAILMKNKKVCLIQEESDILATINSDILNNIPQVPLTQIDSSYVAIGFNQKNMSNVLYPLLDYDYKLFNCIYANAK